MAADSYTAADFHGAMGCDQKSGGDNSFCPAACPEFHVGCRLGRELFTLPTDMEFILAQDQPHRLVLELLTTNHKVADFIPDFSWKFFSDHCLGSLLDIRIRISLSLHIHYSHHLVNVIVPHKSAMLQPW